MEPEAYASSLFEWEALPDSELLRILADGTLFALFVDEVAVGLAGLFRNKGKRVMHRAKVGMVYVRKRARGAGRAGILMQHLIQCARTEGIKQLDLTASGANGGAIRFYEKVGFREVGRMPNGYIHEGSAVDDVIMVLEL